MIHSQEWKIALKGAGCMVATKASASNYNFSTELEVSTVAT